MYEYTDFVLILKNKIVTTKYRIEKKKKATQKIPLKRNHQHDDG